MTLNRIELADLANPTRLAAAIISQLPGLTPPVPIHNIALALDIVEIGALTSDGFEGALITDDAKSDGIILVRKGLWERERFTVGHELGHFLCPHHLPQPGGFQCTSKDLSDSGGRVGTGRSDWEGEANRFAAELLMPTRYFKAALRKSKQLKLDVIFNVAKEFEVSKYAAARRATELSDYSCAVVMSKDDRVIHAPCRSKEFPFVGLGAGRDMPRGSLSRGRGKAEGDFSDIVEVDPSVWLDNPAPGGQLHEQYVAQANGYKMTLLTYFAPDDDET